MPTPTQPTGKLSIQQVQQLSALPVELLDKRAPLWEAAMRQDAIESITKLSWSQTRRGCRVPVFDLYVIPMRRSAVHLVKQFLEHASVEVAATLGRPVDELKEVGFRCTSKLNLSAEEMDVTIARDFWEARVTYRVRFEEELQTHTNQVYSTHVRPFLTDQIEAILTAWQRLGP